MAALAKAEAAEVAAAASPFAGGVSADANDGEQTVVCKIALHKKM